MMRSAGLAVLVAIATAACTTLDPRRAGEASADRNFERQIVVTVPQPRELSTVLLGPPGNRMQRRRGYDATPRVERTLQRLAREHDLVRVDGWPIGSLDVYCEIFEVAPGESIKAVLGRLEADPRIDIAQRMNVFETLAGRYDDPYADLQSATAALGIESAHGLATGRGVTIAVIDSAVDTAHPELHDRVVVARNLVGGSPLPAHGEVHGTAIAGIIASAAGNAEGIVGIAPDVSIAALRACWSDDANRPDARCSTLSLARALELAIGLAPNVINMSLNGPEDPLLTRLLDQVLSRGIIVVTAHPGERDGTGRFPSSHTGVLVAEPMRVGRGSSGPMSLAAPGDEVLTTVPNAAYAFLSGSSLAGAHVSGVVALLLERGPLLDTGQIAALLRRTTVRRAYGESVHACRALAQLIGGGGCEPLAEVVSAGDESRTTR